jgi:hypothetical protein
MLFISWWYMLYIGWWYMLIRFFMMWRVCCYYCHPLVLKVVLTWCLAFVCDGLHGAPSVTTRPNTTRIIYYMTTTCFIWWFLIIRYTSLLLICLCICVLRCWCEMLRSLWCFRILQSTRPPAKFSGSYITRESIFSFNTISVVASYIVGRLGRGLHTDAWC